MPPPPPAAEKPAPESKATKVPNPKSDQSKEKEKEAEPEQETEQETAKEAEGNGEGNKAGQEPVETQEAGNDSETQKEKKSENDDAAKVVVAKKSTTAAGEGAKKAAESTTTTTRDTTGMKDFGKYFSDDSESEASPDKSKGKKDNNDSVDSVQEEMMDTDSPKVSWSCSGQVVSSVLNTNICVSVCS